jgi:hypothetical protein
MTGQRSRGGAERPLGRVVGRLRRALAGDGAPESSVATRSKFPLGPRSIARMASVEPTGDLALVAIVRDEAPYLAEWIEFHRIVGFQRIHIYDNGSIDGTRDVLRPFEREGFVETIDWPITYSRSGHPVRQLTAYLHALEGVGHRWRWMAFLDADEFLFPADAPDLPTLLEGYRDLPALVAYWRMFGTPDRSADPGATLIERCTRMAPFPTRSNTKNVVQPRHVRGVSSVHVFDTTAGRRSAYDDLRRPFTYGDPSPNLWPVGIPGPHSAEHLLLNHYLARAATDHARRERALEEEGREDRVATRRQILDVVDQDVSEDLAIQRFVPALRAALGTAS